MRISAAHALCLLLCAGCSSGSQTGQEQASADKPGALTEELDLSTRFADRTPAYVPVGALDVVIPIYDPSSDTLASGTIIAPDRLLTSAHVIDDFPRDANGRLHMMLDGRPARATVLAAGDPEQGHGDWAILQVARRRWKRSAPVHEAAMDPDWSPPIGAEVLLVGYAAGFFPEGKIDVDDPTPSIPVTICENDSGEPCWFAKGAALDLSGMSGGAVMIWSAERGRAELIGVFRGYTASRTQHTRTTKFLGVPVSSEKVKEVELAYMIHRLPPELLTPSSSRR